MIFHLTPFEKKLNVATDYEMSKSHLLLYILFWKELMDSLKVVCT